MADDQNFYVLPGYLGYLQLFTLKNNTVKKIFEY